MEAINYDELFSEWFENGALHEHVEAIFAVLEERSDDPDLLDQLDWDELLFELLEDLAAQEDFAAILRLRGILKAKYPDLYKEDFDYFADVLMPYYLRTGQRDEAKALWEEWLAKDYNFDMFSPSLNLLAYCGEEALVAEYVEKGYQQPRPDDFTDLPEAQYIFRYKLSLEVGKLLAGQRTAEEVVAEVTPHQVFSEVPREEILQLLEQGVSLQEDANEAVSATFVSFREELISRYAIASLTAQFVVELLLNYYRTRKFHKAASFFKVDEKQLERYMMYNDMGLMLRGNREGNLAMLFALPALFLFLENKGIFTAADRAKETKKVAQLKQRYKKKYPETAAVFDSLAMYQQMGAIVY